MPVVQRRHAARACSPTVREGVAGHARTQATPRYHPTVYNAPLAYFISIRTYGTWLHGDDRGSVDRQHNEFNTPMLPANSHLRRFEDRTRDHNAVVLTDP